MTEEQLRSYLQAWAERDIDRILGGMTEDAVYHASTGPELLGRSYAGRGELRDALERFFETFAQSAWEDLELVVAGDHGYAEWTFRGTGGDGTTTVFRGVDVFAFRDGLVAVKNAFRKASP